MIYRLPRRFTLLLREKVRLRVVTVRRHGLVRDGAHFGGIECRTLLAVRLVSRIICRVEVCLHVRYRHRCVLLGRSCRPGCIAVAPVVQEHVSGRAWNIVGHLVHDLSVDVEDHTAGGPVETVLVELLVWSEWKMLDLVASCTGSIVAVAHRLRRLEHQLHGSLGFVELLGEKFHVDFLRVVVELVALAGRSTPQIAKFIAYPEEGTACTILRGEFHADAVATVEAIVAHCGQFGTADESMRMVAAHPQLQPSITAVYRITRPSLRILQRVELRIGDIEVFAVWSSGVFGGDIVLLWLPAKLGYVVAFCVQKVILQKISEDLVFRVAGCIDRVAALTLGVGCRGASAMQDSWGSMLRLTREDEYAPKRDMVRTSHGRAPQVPRSVNIMQ